MASAALEELAQRIEEVLSSVAPYAGAHSFGTCRAGLDSGGRRLPLPHGGPGNQVDLTSDLCLGIGDDKARLTEQLSFVVDHVGEDALDLPRGPPQKEVTRWCDSLSVAFQKAWVLRAEKLDFIGMACICGEGLIRHHQYAMALQEIYDRYADRIGELVDTSSTGDTAEMGKKVSCGVRFYLGRCFALYQVTIAQDESAQRQDTIDVLRDVLRDIVQAVKLLNSLPESAREESYWAMYNACLLAMRVARWLRLRGFAGFCIASMHWLSQSLGKCLPLVAVHMLPFRARFIEELVCCAEAAQQHARAVAYCTEAIKQVEEAEQLEAMLPPLPAETKQMFDTTVMRLRFLKRKNEYWNGDVAEPKQLCSAAGQDAAPPPAAGKPQKGAPPPPPPSEGLTLDASLVMPLLLEVLQVTMGRSPRIAAQENPQEGSKLAEFKRQTTEEMHAKQSELMNYIFDMLTPTLQDLEDAVKLLDDYVRRRAAFEKASEERAQMEVDATIAEPSAEDDAGEVQAGDGEEDERLVQPLPPEIEELQGHGFITDFESSGARTHRIEEALPLAAHVMLARMCLELEMQRDRMDWGTPTLPGVFDVLERTLALRLRYRHYLNPPLVDIDVVVSSQKKRDNVELPQGYEFLTTDLNEYSLENRQIEAQQQEEIPEGTAIKRPATPPKGTYIFIIGRRYNPWEHWVGECPVAIRRLCNLRIVFAPAGYKERFKKNRKNDGVEPFAATEGFNCFNVPALRDADKVLEPWAMPYFSNSTTDTIVGFEVADEAERLRRSMFQKLVEDGDVQTRSIALQIEAHPGAKEASRRLQEKGSVVAKKQAKKQAKQSGEKAGDEEPIVPHIVFNVFDERALWTKFQRKEGCEEATIQRMGVSQTMKLEDGAGKVQEAPAPPDSEQVLPPFCSLLDTAVAATTPFNDLAVVTSKLVHNTVPHPRFNALIRSCLRQTPGELLGRPFQSYLFLCTAVDAPCTVFAARRLRVMKAFRTLRTEMLALAADEEGDTRVDGALERQRQHPQIIDRFLEFAECVQQLVSGPCGHLFLLHSADLLEDVSAFVFSKLIWKQLSLMQEVVVRNESGESQLTELESIFLAKWSAVMRRGLPTLMRILERVHAVDAATLANASAVLANMHLKNSDAHNNGSRSAQAELGRAIARVEQELESRLKLGAQPAQDMPAMAAVAGAISFDPPSLRPPDFALFQEPRERGGDAATNAYVLVLRGLPRIQQELLCLLTRLYERWIDASMKLHLTNVDSKVSRARRATDSKEDEHVLKPADNSLALALSNPEAAFLPRLGENPYLRALFFVTVSRRRPAAAIAALNKACAEVEKARSQEKELWAYCEAELLEQQKILRSTQGSGGFASEFRARGLAGQKQKPPAHPPMVHSRSPRCIRLRVPPLLDGTVPPVLPSSDIMHPPQQDYDIKQHSRRLGVRSASQTLITCTVFGKAVGTGTTVSELHRELDGTGVRYAGYDHVEIRGLKPNTNYAFACMYFDGFDSSRPALSSISKSSPAIGSYYPLPLALIRLEICRAALQVGEAAANNWNLAWAPLAESFCERVSRAEMIASDGLCTLKLRLDVADRMPPALLADFAELLLARTACPWLSSQHHRPHSSQQASLMLRPAQTETLRCANECLVAMEAARRAGHGNLVLRGISAALKNVRPLFRYRTKPRVLASLLVKCSAALEDFQPSSHGGTWHAKSRRLLTFLHHLLAVVSTQTGQGQLLWRQLESDVPARYVVSQLADENQKLLANQALFEQCLELVLFGEAGWQTSQDKAQLVLDDFVLKDDLFALLRSLSERNFPAVAKESAALVLNTDPSARPLALSILRCAATRALEQGGAEEAIEEVLANHPLVEILEAVLSTSRTRLDSYGFMLRSLPPVRIQLQDEGQGIDEAGAEVPDAEDEVEMPLAPAEQLGHQANETMLLAHLELTKAAPILSSLCGLRIHMHNISRFQYFDLQHIAVPKLVSDDELVSFDQTMGSVADGDDASQITGSDAQETPEWEKKKEEDKATRKQAFELLQQLLVPLTRAAAYANAAKADSLLQSAVVAALNALLITEPSPEECVRPGPRSNPEDADPETADPKAPGPEAIAEEPVAEVSAEGGTGVASFPGTEEVWLNLAILAEFAVQALTRLRAACAAKSVIGSKSAQPETPAKGKSLTVSPKAEQTKALGGGVLKDDAKHKAKAMEALTEEETMVIVEAERASKAMETSDEEFHELWFESMPELDVTSVAKVVAFAALGLYHMRRWNNVITICRNFNDATCSVFATTFLPLAIGAQKEVCILSARAIGMTNQNMTDSKITYEKNQKGYTKKHLRQLALAGELSEAEKLYRKQSEYYTDILSRQKRLDASWKSFLGTLESSHSLAMRAVPVAMDALRKSRMLLAQFLQEREAFSLALRCGTVSDGERPARERILKLTATGLISSYRKAVELLRKKQLNDCVVQALHELGNLQLMEGDTPGAQASWSDAIDMTFQHVHAIKTWRKCVDTAVAAPSSVPRAETMLLSVSILAKHAQLTTPRHATGHLHAALFASAIVEKILTSSLPHPAKRTDFSPDRYRLREILLGLRESHRLHPPNAVHTGVDAATCLAGLEFFQDTLIVLGYQQQRCLPICSLYCYIASDVCRKPALVMKGRLMMTRVLIQCKELGAAWYSLRSIAVGSDAPRGLLCSAFLDSGVQTGTATDMQLFRTSEEPLSEANVQALGQLLDWEVPESANSVEGGEALCTFFSMLQCEFCLAALANVRIFSEAGGAAEKVRSTFLERVDEKLGSCWARFTGNEEDAKMTETGRSDGALPPQQGLGIKETDYCIEIRMLRSQCQELSGDLACATAEIQYAMQFMQHVSESIGTKHAKACGFAEGPHAADAADSGAAQMLRLHADMKRWLALRRRIVQLLIMQGRMAAAVSHIEQGILECGRAHDELAHVELLAARARVEMMTGRLLELRGEHRAGALPTLELCLAVSARHLPVPTLAAVRARMLLAVLLGRAPSLASNNFRGSAPSVTSARSDGGAGGIDADTLALLEAKNLVVLSPAAKAVQQRVHQERLLALKSTHPVDQMTPEELEELNPSRPQQEEVSNILSQCLRDLDAILDVQGFELRPCDINGLQHFGEEGDGSLGPVPANVLPAPGSTVPCPSASFQERLPSDARTLPNMFLEAMSTRLHCEVYLAQILLDLDCLQEARRLLVEAEQRLSRCVHPLPWLFVQFCVVKLRWRRRARHAGLIPHSEPSTAPNAAKYNDPQMFADGLSPATLSPVFRTFLIKARTPLLAASAQWMFPSTNVAPAGELMAGYLGEVFGPAGLVELALLEGGHDPVQLAALLREGIEEVLYVEGKRLDSDDGGAFNMLHVMFSCLVAVADHHKALHYESAAAAPVVEEAKGGKPDPKKGGDAGPPSVDLAVLPQRVRFDIIRALCRQEQEGALAYSQPDALSKPVLLRTLAKILLAMQRDSSRFINLFHDDRFLCDQLHVSLTQVSEPYMRAKVLDKTRLKGIVESPPGVPSSGAVLIHWMPSEKLATAPSLSFLCFLCGTSEEEFTIARRPLVARCEFGNHGALQKGLDALSRDLDHCRAAEKEFTIARRPLVARCEFVNHGALQKVLDALSRDLDHCRAAEKVAAGHFSERLTTFACLLRGPGSRASDSELEQALSLVLAKLAQGGADVALDEEPPGPPELLDAKAVQETLKVLISMLDVSSTSVQVEPPIPELGLFLQAVLAPLSVSTPSR